MRWLGASFLGCFLLAAGCSSGSGGGSSGGGANVTGLCTKSCQAEQALQCPNEGPLQTCVTNCETELADYGESCPSEVTAYLECASDVTPICGPEGTAGYTQEMIQSACGPELQGFTACFVCTPAPEDDACDQCLKSSCCESFKAVVTDPQFSAYSACDDMCDVQFCSVPCSQQYPGIYSKIEASAACLAQNCSTCI
jgi:hypothetical protein